MLPYNSTNTIFSMICNDFWDCTEFQSFKVPKFQNVKVSKIQSSQISKPQTFNISKLCIFCICPRVRCTKASKAAWVGAQARALSEKLHDREVLFHCVPSYSISCHHHPVNRPDSCICVVIIMYIGTHIYTQIYIIYRYII